MTSFALMKIIGFLSEDFFQAIQNFILDLIRLGRCQADIVHCKPSADGFSVFQRSFQFSGNVGIKNLFGGKAVFRNIVQRTRFCKKGASVGRIAAGRVSYLGVSSLALAEKSSK